MITNEQKERLREMGRKEGAIVYGKRIDKADLTDDQWAAAWAVWCGPGSKADQFVTGSAHPDYVEASR
jgi:hypothetical protein